MHGHDLNEVYNQRYNNENFAMLDERYCYADSFLLLAVDLIKPGLSRFKILIYFTSNKLQHTEKSATTKTTV